MKIPKNLLKVSITSLSLDCTNNCRNTEKATGNYPSKTTTTPKTSQLLPKCSPPAK